MTIEELKDQNQRKNYHLVGKFGSFIGGDGVTRSCKVTELDEWPYDETLVIDYIRDGEVVKGAMLPVERFVEGEAHPELAVKQTDGKAAAISTTQAGGEG